MVIHTLGDSHCAAGWRNVLPDERIHWLGAKLCYSVGRDGLPLKSNYNPQLNRPFNINNGDTVIFSFGEIDCRCHVHKYITEEKTYKDIIDEIVDKYFVSIQNAVNEFEQLKAVVYNVVPTVEKKHYEEDAGFPFLGTDEERKQYVLYFNERLRQKCLEYNYVFCNIYDKYTDTNGLLNKDQGNGVHIKDDPIHLKAFIENNLQ
jgi:hypothetical protein